MPLWINNFFIELANGNKKIGLTIHCGGVNANGPGRFRTKGDNPAKQVCYFNTPNNDQLFNVFVSKMINFDNSPADIYFQIDKVKSKTNSETFDANSLLLQDGSAMTSQQKSMKMALDLDRIGSEMIELLGRNNKV